MREPTFPVCRVIHRPAGFDAIPVTYICPTSIRYCPDIPRAGLARRNVPRLLLCYTTE